MGNPELRTLKRSEMPEQNSMRASASEFLNWIMLGGFVALAATTGKLPQDVRPETPTVSMPVAQDPAKVPAPQVREELSLTAVAADESLAPNEILLGRVTIQGGVDTGVGAAPVRPDEMESMVAELKTYMTELRTPEGAARVPMLSEGSIRTACRFASDWFLKENAHLGEVFTYLERRSGAWTPDFTMAVKRVIEQSMGYVKDEPALMALVQAKLKEGQPFKCGFLLNMAQPKLTTIQALGILFLTEAAAQIEHDSKSSESEVRDVAKKASKALVSSIATAMGDK